MKWIDAPIVYRQELQIYRFDTDILIIVPNIRISEYLFTVCDRKDSGIV